MSRYIDADDVLELLDLMYDNQADKDDPYNVGVMGAINYIKHKAPSIEICFCRECKYAEFCEKKIHRHGIAYSIDFCSYGERKEQ